MRQLRKKINVLRIRRRSRTRAKISGSLERPRLSVYRSQKHLSVQAIDDLKGFTVASVSDNEVKGKDRKEQALAMGKMIASKLMEKNINKVVFDKGHYQYHGLVELIARGARENGLDF